MKFCDTLPADPPGLATFRADNPTAVDWAIFRSNHSLAYKELANALEARQRGQCAFCETRLFTDIPTPARQVEHWHPKSNGGYPAPHITFGVDNLHASCLGGSKPHLSPPFGPLGLAAGEHLSCGQKKGEKNPAALPLAERPYRPTELPLSPPAFSVEIDGSLGVNPDAVAAGLSATRLVATIAFLGLDCERLRIARASIRAYLDDQLANYEAEEVDLDPLNSMRNALARLASHLSVQPSIPLPPFITVLRDFFGPANEGLLLPDPDWAVG